MQVQVTRWEITGGFYKLEDYKPGDENYPNARMFIVDASLLERFRALKRQVQDLQKELERL